MTLAYKVSFSLAVFYPVKRFYYLPKMLGAIAWAGLSKVDEVAVAPGKLIPGEQDVQPVRSPSSGKIKFINETKIKEGQQVQKGDLLVALDSESFLADIEKLNNQAQLIKQNIQLASQAGDESQKARIQEAEIELDGLRKQLVFSKNQANRLRSIAGAISRIKVEKAQQEVQDLETKIAAKQQEIQQLRQNYKTGFLSDLSVSSAKFVHR